MKKTILFRVLTDFAVYALGWVLFKSGPPPTQIQAQEQLALCLRDQNATMYGAEWCSHCQSQKRLFGEAFKFVPYVECPDNPQACTDVGIKGYPTWIFPNGQRIEGEVPLEKIAQASNCPLQTENQ